MSLLWLSDTSPLFTYSPSPAFFQGTGNTASWKVSFDSSQRQLNDTQHTSPGPGAVALPAVYATSFTPIFNSKPGVTPQLALGDGAPAAWTSGQNFSEINGYSPQTFILSAGGELSFRGAWISTQSSSPGSDLASAQLDDASSLVTYSGFSPVGNNPADAVSAGSLDYSGTLSITTTSGASATVTFNAMSIVVTGVTGPTSGPYTVALDGSVVANLNACQEVEAHGVVLFYASNLDLGRPHTLVLTAMAGDQGATGLVLDSFTAYGPTGGASFSGGANGGPAQVNPPGRGNGGSVSILPSTTASTTARISGGIPNGSPNAGVIVGAILGALAGVFILLWLFRKRMALKKPGNKPLNAWDEANMLQNMKNEEIHVTTVAKQRYVYPGLVAHSELKRY